MNIFWVACLFELSLLLLALISGPLLGTPPLANWKWGAGEFVLGFLAALPPFLLLCLLARYPPKWFMKIQVILRQCLPVLLPKPTAPRLLLLSMLAGLGEEFLFRGVLQSWLIIELGSGMGLVMASLVFGVCHWVTPGYAILAGVMGLYLGALMIFTDSLAAPAAAHVVYDFLAFLHLRNRLHWK